MKKEKWLKLKNELNALNEEELKIRLDKLFTNNFEKTIKCGTNENVESNLIMDILQKLKLDKLEVYEGEWISKLPIWDITFTSYKESENAPETAYKKLKDYFANKKGVELSEQQRKDGVMTLKITTRKYTYYYITNYYYCSMVTGEEEVKGGIFDKNYTQKLYENGVAIRLSFESRVLN